MSRRRPSRSKERPVSPFNRRSMSCPTAEDLGISSEKSTKSEEDEFAEIAQRYGVVFDEDGEIAADDSEDTSS